MKSLFISLSVLFLLGCSSFSSHNAVDLGDQKKVTLKNGLEVLLMKDQSLPYVSMTMLIKSGSANDPEKLSGLASMTASLLNRGTAKRNASQLAESLEQIGANFGASVSKDYTVVSASGLSFHQASVLKDFSEVIVEPSFPSREIERVRSLKLSAIKQSLDNPSAFVGRIFDDYLYGDHPYGSSSMGISSNIRRIRKKNIIRHYLSVYRPNNAMLAVVGNYSDDIVNQLEDSFKDWAPRDVENKKISQFPEIKGLQVELVHRADLQQTQIRFGNKGIERTNPDFLKIRVANTILSGAFTGRLFREIRTKRGLTYSISSYFDARKSEGPFVISTFTRHEKTNETIVQTLNEVKKFRQDGVTEEEVKQAKELLKGMFVQALETPEDVAETMLVLKYYGIPKSYLTDYISDIEDISVSDVNGIIKKYFDSDNMKVLVYGPKSKTFNQLKSIGKVQVKNYQDFL